MRHKFLVLTVTKWLKLYLYISYRKIKTRVPLVWTTVDCFRGWQVFEMSST